MVEQKNQLKLELNIECKKKSKDIKKENILEGKHKCKPLARYVMRAK